MNQPLKIVSETSKTTVQDMKGLPMEEYAS